MWWYMVIILKLQRRENQEFKVIFDDTLNWRSAWPQKMEQGTGSGKKALLCKRENLSQIPSKKPGVVVPTCNSRAVIPIPVCPPQGSVQTSNLICELQVSKILSQRRLQQATNLCPPPKKDQAVPLGTESKAQWSGIHGQSQLQSEFQVSLDYMRPNPPKSYLIYTNFTS